MPALPAQSYKRADALIDDLIGFFHRLEPWVAGIGAEAMSLAGLDRPPNDPNELYAHADRWGRMSDHLGSVVDQLAPLADALITDWNGDGASMQWYNLWQQNTQGISDTQQSAAANGQGVAAGGAHQWPSGRRHHRGRHLRSR